MRGGKRDHGRRNSSGRGRSQYNSRTNDYEMSKENNLPTGAIVGLPILRPPKIGRESSIEESKIYSNWMTAMERYIRIEYDDIADVFTSGKLPTYPEIVIPPEANIGINRWAVRKQVEKQINIREEKIERLERNKRSAFAAIMRQLSSESLAKIKIIAGYDKMIADHNVEVLIERIIATHMAAMNIDEEETKFDVRKKYNELRQGKFYETVDSYRERFENAIDALRAVGENIPTQPQQAYDFLAGLDNNRYYQLKLDYKNRVDKTMSISTLDEAYMQASTYIIPRRSVEYDTFYMNRGK